MGFLRFCNTIEEAEQWVGIIAEYIDIDYTKREEYYSEVVEYDKWITENCNGRVAAVQEQEFNKYFLVLLFQNSEDAVGFKLVWL